MLASQQQSQVPAEDVSTLKENLDLLPQVWPPSNVQSGNATCDTYTLRIGFLALPLAACSCSLPSFPSILTIQSIHPSTHPGLYGIPTPALSLSTCCAGPVKTSLPRNRHSSNRSLFPSSQRQIPTLAPSFHVIGGRAGLTQIPSAAVNSRPSNDLCTPWKQPPLLSHAVSPWLRQLRLSGISRRRRPPTI